MTPPSGEMTKGYVDTLMLPNILDIQVQVFIIHNFLSFSFGKFMGKGNCYM